MCLKVCGGPDSWTTMSLSVTISYGQGGQTCLGCLNCCCIFLKLAWLGLRHVRRSSRLQRTNGCRSRVLHFSPLSLGRGVMDEFGPPTVRHGGAPTTGPKLNNEPAAAKQKKKKNQDKKLSKTKTLNGAADGAELEWLHTRGYSFGEYLHAQRALFSARLVPLCSSIAEGMRKLGNPDLRGAPTMMQQKEKVEYAAREAQVTYSLSYFCIQV